jgi:hypothetical protein
MRSNFTVFLGIILTLVVCVNNDYAGTAKQEEVVPGPGQGYFIGYVRTQILPGSPPKGLKGCRVIVLDSAAPGLFVGHPISSTDTVQGPATLFADYTTDSSGYYKILLPVGSYKVIFWASSHIPVTESVIINQGENAPVFGYYENEERPIKPGVTVNPWRGGIHTHNFLEFEDNVTRNTAPLPAPGNKLYRDPEWNFSIEKPSDEWHLLYGPLAEAEVDNARLYMEFETEAAAALFVQNVPGTTLDQILEVSLPDLENRSIVLQRDIGFGEVKGIYYEVEGSMEGTLFYWVIGTFQYGETIYQIHCWTDRSLKSQYEGVFNKILDSFRIIERDLFPR